MNLKHTPASLKKVENIFDEAGYSVRYEKGNFASGYCLLELRKVVVINKFLSVEGRINALLEILPSIPADFDSLSAESQKLLSDLAIVLPEHNEIKEEEEEEE